MAVKKIPTSKLNANSFWISLALKVNPFTLRSDLHVNTFPCNIKTMSCRQVARIDKCISHRRCYLDTTFNSLK